ncbi:MAG: L-histidine N(alpha)-methyltransferase [Bacteroidota bacterium]
MNYNENLDLAINQVGITSYLQKIDMSAVRNEILAGLSASGKYISSKFFYDEKGSGLFEKITKLPEYYPTRCEKEILQSIDLSFLKTYENLHILELGSGDHTKISLLLNHIPTVFFNTLTYYPIDISKSAIQDACEKLVDRYQNITIQGFVADFVQQLDIIPHGKNRLFCFLGSTIGNFTEEQRIDFLVKMNQIMTDDDYFLLGVDTIKNKIILENAYNDKQGITEAFNLNVLNVVNAICETDFDTNDFKHIAFFNEDKKRIEMHLEALTDVVVKSNIVPVEIFIAKGERIHTEYSHKFDDNMISHMAEKSEFQTTKVFSDKNAHFKLILFTKARTVN